MWARWSTPRPGPIYPRNITQRTMGRPQDRSERMWKREKSLTPTGDRTRNDRSVVCRHTDWGNTRKASVSEPRSCLSNSSVWRKSSTHTATMFCHMSRRAEGNEDVRVCTCVCPTWTSETVNRYPRNFVWALCRSTLPKHCTLSCAQLLKKNMATGEIVRCVRH
jgi:hypothetical protein